MSRGHNFEREVANWLAERGWLVASLRHRLGAGDLLAIHPEFWPILVECKFTTAPPWRSSWGPGERRLLADTAAHYHAVAYLAWRPPRGVLSWSTVDDWPGEVAA